MSSFNISLLIQHADSRSETTIPYKTYDYINIGNPILALTNNDELSHLLSENNHIVVDVNNVILIKNTIIKILNSYEDFKDNINPLAINIISQTEEILKRNSIHG